MVNSPQDQENIDSPQQIYTNFDSFLKTNRLTTNHLNNTHQYFNDYQSSLKPLFKNNELLIDDQEPSERTPTNFYSDTPLETMENYE